MAWINFGRMAAPRCPYCHTKLVWKTGVGWICPRCGWVRSFMIKALAWVSGLCQAGALFRAKLAFAQSKLCKA